MNIKKKENIIVTGEMEVGWFWYFFYFLVSCSFMNTILAGRRASDGTAGCLGICPSPSDLGAAHIFLQCKTSPPPLLSRDSELLRGRCRRWGLLALDL